MRLMKLSIVTVAVQERNNHDHFNTKKKRNFRKSATRVGAGLYQDYNGFHHESYTKNKRF